MLGKKIKMVCDVCGDADVVMDANAVWSVEKQAWVFAGVCDTAYCGGCDDACNLKEVEVDDQEAA